MTEPGQATGGAPTEPERSGEGERPPAPSFVGPRVVGVGLLVLGVIVLVQTLEIGRSTGYSPVGPRFVPTVVALGLILLSLLFLARTTVRPDGDLGERAALEERATHWPTVGMIGVVLTGYAFVLGPLGYPLATAAFVPLGARILGSRSPLRDLVLGVIVGLVVWFGFTQLLGVRLPSGLLDPLLPGSG